MTTWDGRERRIQDHTNPVIICKQEDKINEMHAIIYKIDASIARLDMRINGSLEKMSMHVEDSVYWRRFIVGIAISLIISILGGASALLSLSYNLGEYTRQIKINTARIDKVEVFHERLAEKGQVQ